MTGPYSIQFWQRRTNVWRKPTSPARGISDQEAEKPYWRSTSVPAGGS
jgi:hypothetical protein